MAVPPSGPAAAGAAAMVFVEDPAVPVPGDDDAHHLFDVLRLRDGEVVVASDGAGGWVRCLVERGPRPRLSPEGGLRFEPRPGPTVTVAFAPVKGERPEWVVQKLTELGVDRIVPLVTGRSVVRWPAERARRAVERLRRVAREASAQSRRAHLPEVTPVTTFADLAVGALGPVVLAHPGGGPPTLEVPTVAVGPEGGWDGDELSAGLPLVGLGPTVLRAETAAMTAGALLTALRSGLVGPIPDNARQ